MHNCYYILISYKYVQIRAFVEKKRSRSAALEERHESLGAMMQGREFSLIPLMLC